MPKLGVFSYLCKFFAKQNIPIPKTTAQQMENIVSDESDGLHYLC